MPSREAIVRAGIIARRQVLMGKTGIHLRDILQYHDRKPGTAASYFSRLLFFVLRGDEGLVAL